MPFAVLALLFVFGSVWRVLYPVLIESRADNDRWDHRPPIVIRQPDRIPEGRSEQLASYCEARFEEAAATFEREANLCPRRGVVGIYDSTQMGAQKTVEQMRQSPMREDTVAFNYVFSDHSTFSATFAFHPEAAHDSRAATKSKWRDSYDAQLGAPFFREATREGRTVILRSTNQSAPSQNIFVRRFTAAAESCLAEGARIDAQELQSSEAAENR